MITRFRIPDWFLLLAFCLFFFFWRLSSLGLIGADEPRYAQVGREMLQRADWVTPTLGGDPWLEKPPLYYWQTIMAYKLFGVSDWAARLPSAFDALLLVFALWWFLRRFRPGLELDGALMLASAAGWIGYARAASMDMPLAATFAVAMLAWFAWFESGDKRYLAVGYSFLALATLAKGPVAPLLALLIVSSFAAVQRSLPMLISTLWWPGMALFCAIAVPWYVLVQMRNPQFFQVFIVEHNLARFGTNLYHHPEPFWYYVPVSLLGWIPWSVFVLVAIFSALRRFRGRDQDSLDAFLVIWILLTVSFFSISGSKLPGYILPVIPAGIALIVNYIRHRLSERPSVALAATHAIVAASLLFAALNIQTLVVRHRISWDQSLLFPALAAIAAGILIYLMIVRSGYPALRLVTLVPAVIALAMAVRLGSPLLDQTLSSRPLWHDVSRVNPHNLPVAVFLVPRETEFGLQFYFDRSIPRYELGQVPHGEHLVVAAQGYPKGVSKVAGRKAAFLGNSAPQKLDIFYVPAK